MNHWGVQIPSGQRDLRNHYKWPRAPCARLPVRLGLAGKFKNIGSTASRRRSHPTPFMLARQAFLFPPSSAWGPRFPCAGRGCARWHC